MFSSYSWTSVLGLAGSATLLALGKRYFSGGVNPHLPDLTGKTVIVTGSNTGIGFETASKLCELGAHVVMACRDKSRATEAIRSIKKRLNNKCSIEFIGLDLTERASIEAFARTFKEKHPKLNILINNAGVMGPTHKTKTKDGLEFQIGVNHFGHFLLTSLLLDKLQAGAPSRVVNVSSAAHLRGQLDIDDLFFEKRAYSAFPVYCQSKLANVLFTAELNRRYAEEGITSYSLHPGGVITEIGRNVFPSWLAPLGYLLYPLAYYFLKSPYEGAQTTLYCALAPGLEKDAGNYFQDCVKSKTAPAALDIGLSKKLWEKSEEVWGISFGNN